MRKNNKGITLIALVVTIIILLILAGVSIMTLTGDNGIITRTSKSKKLTKDAEIAENIKLAFMNAQIGKYAGKRDETFTDEKIKTAKRLIKLKIPIEQIAKATELTVDEIKQIEEGLLK